MTRAEIQKTIYDKYPVTKAERKCANEKRILDGLRWKFKKELMKQEREKKEYEAT